MKRMTTLDLKSKIEQILNYLYKEMYNDYGMVLGKYKLLFRDEEVPVLPIITLQAHVERWSFYTLYELIAELKDRKEKFVFPEWFIEYYGKRYKRTEDVLNSFDDEAKFEEGGFMIFKFLDVNDNYYEPYKPYPENMPIKSLSDS